MKTYWNGEPAEAMQCMVRVGPASVKPNPWWCASLVGTQRAAVQVDYQGRVFYLDDADGEAWAKVTNGRGSPRYGHRALPDTSEVLRGRGGMRRFALVDLRGEERTVAEGVESSSGTVVVFWLGETPSTVLWPSFDAFETVSVGGHDHEGALTRRIDWRDE